MKTYIPSFVREAQLEVAAILKVIFEDNFENGTSLREFFIPRKIETRCEGYAAEDEDSPDYPCGKRIRMWDGENCFMLLSTGWEWDETSLDYHSITFNVKRANGGRAEFQVPSAQFLQKDSETLHALRLHLK